MRSLLVPHLMALSEAAGESSGPSPWWFGLFALAVLVGLLAVTMILGKGRPHS
jgi:MYXO-CTERM domain-containing protein